MFLLYKSLVANFTEIQAEWDDPPANPQHRDADGKGHCLVEKELWHTCLCNPDNPFYECDLVDGPMLVIVPPAMVSDWREDIERLIKEDKTDERSGVYIIAHEAYGKGSAKVSSWKDELIGIRPQIPSQLESDEEPDADAPLVWNDRMGRFVLKSPVKGKYLSGRPQAGSSRFLIITTAGSYEGHVQAPLTSKGYEWYSGSKQGKSNSVKGIPLVCPAITVVDEAHLVRQENAGHFGIINKIQRACNYVVKTAWLTGTLFGKRPSDVAAIFKAMQFNGAWTEGKLAGLNAEAMNRIDLAYMGIEDSIRQGTSIQKHSSKLIDEIMRDLTSALWEVMIRHTSDSIWFSKCIKKPLPHTDLDINISFPAKYTPLLINFDRAIKTELQAIKPPPRQPAGKPVISKTRILSCARLYRIASSLPFMLKFWSRPENTKFQMTSAQMKEWIKDGKMDPDCPLYSHIEEILATSPKLDYIGRVLDAWDDEKDGKLLVLTEFVVVAFFVVLVCLFLHASKGVNSSHVSS